MTKETKTVSAETIVENLKGSPTNYMIIAKMGCCIFYSKEMMVR